MEGQEERRIHTPGTPEGKKGWVLAVHKWHVMSLIKVDSGMIEYELKYTMVLIAQECTIYHRRFVTQKSLQLWEMKIMEVNVCMTLIWC